MKSKNMSVGTLLLLVFQTQFLFAADWPQFRGPRRDGTVDSPVMSSASGLNIDWKRPLGAGGYSGIVIADGRAHTSFSDGQDDYVIALEEETGKELWRFRLDRTFPGRGGADAGPLSTPSVAGKKIFVLSPFGSFYGLSAITGRTLWKVDIKKALGGRQPDFGFTSSPLVVDDTVVLQVGGRTKNTLVAFDSETGRQIWSTYVDQVEYASPAYLRLAGQAQIVSRTNRHTYAVLPGGGKVLWDIKEFLGQQSHATPFAISANEVLVAGFDSSILLRVDRINDRFLVKKTWTSKDLRGNFSEPVFYKGHIYGYNAAFFTCIDARSGEAVWKSREPGDGSFILVGNILVMLDSGGTVYLAEATPKGLNLKTKLAVLEGTTVSAPSFANGFIFLRSLTEIARITINE